MWQYAELGQDKSYTWKIQCHQEEEDSQWSDQEMAKLMADFEKNLMEKYE
jgi:hypothetical protein